MNRLRKFLAVTGVLALSANQLPAPILEPTPEATTAKPRATPAKHRSSEASDSLAARRFNGTWKGTGSSNTAGATSTFSATLIIKDGKTADASTEVTATLQDPRGWANFSEESKHASPLSYKYSNHSDHLVIDGIDLMIRWSGRRIVDWAPKIVRLKELEQTIIKEEPRVSTFTLKGDELVVGNGQFVYHRAK